MRKAVRHFLKTGSIILFAAVLSVMLWPLEAKAGWDKGEDQDLFESLVAQGYSWQVATDEVWERKGYPDAYGTGGIDGICKYGTYAAGGAQNKTSGHTHSWGEGVITKEASCTEEGKLTFTCSCGKTKEEKIPKLDHEYVLKSETPATCTTYRTQHYECSMCGDPWDKEYSEEGYADHIYIPSEDSIPATCTEPGKIHYVCNICQDDYDEEEPAKGHQFNKYTIDKQPSCLETGEKSIYCDECGELKEDSTVTIEKTGHKENPEKKITEATFFKNGLETTTCIDCGATLNETVIPATGGIFSFIIPLAGIFLICIRIILIFRLKKK